MNIIGEPTDYKFSVYNMEVIKVLDFKKYFLSEHQIFLDNINYETLKLERAQGEVKLGCKDTIVAQLIDSVGVKFTFNRTMSFDEGGMFFLSVTYGAMLRFNPATYGEVMWKNMDLAGEFKMGCPHILTNLMSRTSLMIAQITSASGQNPIITPGGVAIQSGR